MNEVYSDYYVSQISGNQSIPLIEIDDDSPLGYFYRRSKIDSPELMKFRIGKPIPRKPVMADYHSSSNGVVSKKIFDILNSFEIEGIQLLPSIIRDKLRSIEYDNYWAIHIYNRIECVDKELSDCKVGTGLSYVKKIVLDEKIIKEIPLEKRLIFRLKEDVSFQMYHKSIVEAIMAVNPTGLRFIPIEEYHEGSLFE